MSSRTFDGNPESAGPGFCPAPPPPPPPPVAGQVPALRINTVEAPVPRRSLPNSNNNPYEPPAAIQNAMMTKDKKPFTYTPGMGGKLDLSQIRSPRMARRVAKNANDEGIEGPPKSSLATEPRPVSAAPNLYIQPQVAVPVFPTNVQLQPSANRNSCAPPSRVPSNASDRGAEVQRPIMRVETKPISQVVSPQPTPPETPTTPPQVTLAKAPTPWLQNKNKPQEELPEWAKRSSVIRPSSSTSPESPVSPTAQIQILQSQPQVSQTIQLQQTPGSPTRQQQPPPPSRQQTQQHERVIPLRIEDRPSVFSVKNEAGHHQFKQQPQQQSQPSSHHQQRWGNATPPQTPSQTQVPQFHNQNHQQQYQQPPRPHSSGGGTYIVPIMVEGSSNNGPSASTYNQPQPIRNQNVQNPSPRVIVQRGPPSPQIQQQGEPGPVQSRSFRVLQKITDTDVPDEVDGEQLRKLQLTEDDKVLMNKFKEQVDGDGNYLHQEEDPRYRGAAIPSRAFRFLQNMTDSGDVTTTANAPRAPSAINKRQNRNSRTFEDSQANLPPSEQQAPEPKKYTGSAIPSRSFRILQAMTSPESIAKQENRQAVIICRTESSMQPGNHQQAVFLSSSFPHDSSSLPLAEQSSQLSHLNASQLQSSQSHNSQSSESQSSHLQPQESQSQSSKSSKVPISKLQLTDPQLSESHETQQLSELSELQESQSNPSQLEASSLLSSSHQSQMKSLRMQFSQFQPSLPPLPPPFWQHPDGSFWWSYYPLHYQTPQNAPSSSSSSSSSAKNHPSLSHNTRPMPSYETAYPIVCNHHHHHDGTAFAYYHPFFDERFYAAATAAAAAISSSAPSGISSFDAVAAQRSADLSSSLSSPTDETLGETTNALPEDSSCSSQLLYASTPSTMPQQSACLLPAFAHPQPTKTLLGYDSNCNPCLERTERSCAGETIFRCQPAFVQKPSTGPPQGYSGSNDSNPRTMDQGMRNSWISQDPALTEPGPPPWVRNNEREFPETEVKSDHSIDNGNEVGWNLDGTIGNPEKLQRSEDQFMKAKLNDAKIGSETSPQTDRRLKMEKSAKIGNDSNAHRVLDDEKLKSNASRVETKERWSKSNADPQRVDRETEIGEQRWNRIDNASRNLNEIEPSIPMNILHDECNVNESPVIDKVKNNDDRCAETNVTDTDSDTDTGDSSADVEPVCTDRATNTEDDSETESDSDDSDSYLAYSTGLNPHNKFVRQTINRVDEDYRKSQTATTISEDAFDESTFAMSSDKLNSTDCESCVEEDEDVEQIAKIDDTDRADFLSTKAEDISPHRLSVIPEDSEQNDRGAATPSAIGSDGWQNVTDDHSESATVNISLPLKFRFSVAEHEKETTGDVCVNLKLTDDTDTSADFTLKTKNILQESVKEDKEDAIDFWKTEETKSDPKIIESIDDKSEKEETKVNDDSKNTVNQDDSIDFWETITSGRVTPDLNIKSKRQRGIEKYYWKDEIPLEEEIEKNSGDDEEIKEESSPSLKIDDSSRSEEEEEEDNDDEESETAECPDDEEIPNSEDNDKEESAKIASTPLFELTEAKNDDNEESSGRSNLENSKHLLSVQNSRDETDDEDSGVTSDMSRLISEVDTDSECGPTRRINSYKRTQTHSRLFRLLSREDDPQISEDTKNNTTARRDRLSLPLKSSGFSYDESHHYSNYSSGLTSPDYSPVYEGTWRRLHGDENATEKPQSPGGVINDDESVKNRKDSYYENWKKTISDDKIREETISSAEAFKIVDNGNGRNLPNWRFRNNVLCPRIKSTKNVPRTVRNNRSAKPVISNSSAAKSVGKINDNVF